MQRPNYLYLLTRAMKNPLSIRSLDKLDQEPDPMHIFQMMNVLLWKEPQIAQRCGARTVMRR